jgi:hypothetical protein
MSPKTRPKTVNNSYEAMDIKEMSLEICLRVAVINACEFFVAFTRTNSDNRRVMPSVGHKSSGVRECYCQESRDSPSV